MLKPRDVGSSFLGGETGSSGPTGSRCVRPSFRSRRRTEPRRCSVCGPAESPLLQLLECHEGPGGQGLKLFRQRQRGWCQSTHLSPPVASLVPVCGGMVRDRPGSRWTQVVDLQRNLCPGDPGYSQSEVLIILWSLVRAQHGLPPNPKRASQPSRWGGRLLMAASPSPARGRTARSDARTPPGARASPWPSVRVCAGQRPCRAAVVRRRRWQHCRPEQRG